jgi:twinkle protein
LQIERDAIMQAKEKLGDENARIIVEELGITDYDERDMKCCCPFHAENHASFIYNKKAYNFRCFGACSRSYDILDVFMLKGMTYNQACRKLFELAGMPYSFGELGVKTRRQYQYPKEVVCDDKSQVYEYFKKRKISPSTIDYADVRQDDEGNTVFNYYDTNDVLTMVKYRPSRRINKGENKCWCQKGADTTPLLFNMNRINTTVPLLICEGEPDCLSAIEAGFTNAVSVPLGSTNFHWIEENWDWLEQFDSIIICSDNDEAGLKMQRECIYRLGSWRTKVVEIPRFFINEETKEKRAINDLNEVLYFFGKEKVLELILDAKESPVPGVVDFSDIEDVDLDALDGIPTGLPNLDRYLMKLFYGTLNIVTGINGSGKSSFLNQVICQCLDRGENAYLFSGELPNFQAKNWLNFIFAGQRNVKECSFNDSVFYKVTPEAKKAISEFYRGRLYIRKDGESNKKTDIIKSMEDSVRKYGTKLLILDNMTAMDLEGNDNNKYDKQAELIMELIAFAVKFNVVVILVVHPHKIDMMRRLNKMDVQGISAIIDLAHRIISLYRVQEKDKQGEPKLNGSGWRVKPIKADVIIDILKDRLTGYESRSIEVFYDRPSKRFFTNEAELDYRYKWDQTVYKTPLPFPPQQLLEVEDDNEVFGKINE